jgi:Uma2 family endonuclease
MTLAEAIAASPSVTPETLHRRCTPGVTPLRGVALLDVPAHPTARPLESPHQGTTIQGGTGMSAEFEQLLKTIEGLPEPLRAQIVDAEIIVSPAPVNQHAYVISRLREAIGKMDGLIALEATTVGLGATEEAYIPDLACYAVSDLDPQAWLNPAHALVMAVEVVSGADRGNAARRDRRDKVRGYAASGVPLYLLVDRPRRAVVLHSVPKYSEQAKSERYSHITQVGFGDPLELPEPFGRTVDTGQFTG